MNPYYNPFINPQPAINQNFTVAGAEMDGKYADSIEVVKNTLALKPTMFINPNHSLLWLKDTTGQIKAFNLTEIVEKDEKDVKIENLEFELKKIKEALSNVTNANTNVNSTQSANGGATTTINADWSKPSTINTTNDTASNTAGITSYYTTG